MMKRWTKEEEQKLRDLYATHTAKDLAILLGRSVRSVQVKLFHLGLCTKGFDHRRIKLNDEQKLWLRLNFPHMATILCAMRLGISLRSVIRIARQMGLEKTKQFMKECQAHANKKSVESNLKNGTFPPKGYYSPNLQKGKPYQFKPGHRPIKPPF